jgi:hypothetical protein
VRADDPSVVEALRIARARIAAGSVREATSCANITPIVPPVTVQGTLATSDCVSDISTREDAYSFSGTAGRTIRIDYYSSAFDVFLVLDGPSTLEFGDRISFLSDGTSRKTLDYKLPASGTYTIEAMTLWDYNDTSHPVTGPYTMAVTYPGSSTGCTPSATTICLNSDRFAVSVTFKVNGVTSNATAIEYTDNSGLFWFFGADNLEIVMKILNGCGINNKYWVFTAATTNVEYHLTVVDKKTGTSKTYNNVAGPPAPAITDTNAFATCP